MNEDTLLTTEYIKAFVLEDRGCITRVFKMWEYGVRPLLRDTVFSIASERVAAKLRGDGLTDRSCKGSINS